jgi:hypothetical protein
MEKNILFRTVIEVLGKPKEHVEESLKSYIKNLKENENFEVISEEFAQIQKQEDSDMWMNFAELEIKTSRIEDLIAFCFEYMPSLVEIIEPKQITFQDIEITQFLNDLQSKLHHVDMVAKQVKMENDLIKRSTGSLLRNYITVLLKKGNLTSNQLSKLTGLVQDKIEDFLDQMIDEGKIDMKEGIYFIKELKN